MRPCPHMNHLRKAITMPIALLDSQGAEVIALQGALKTHGFDPGAIDGDFGPGTEAAVIAFQKNERLNPDGKVGPATRMALGLPPPKTQKGEADVTGKVTARMVSRMFPSTPLGNIVANLPCVLAELRAAVLGDKPMILMALGTIRAETERFEPISEGVSRFNTSPNGHPFDLYDQRKDLGNRGVPDGASFRGRGFVQLTGRANYTTYGGRPGLRADLTAHPEKANDPVIAARLLALFLKDKEKRFVVYIVL